VLAAELSIFLPMIERKAQRLARTSTRSCLLIQSTTPLFGLHRLPRATGSDVASSTWWQREEECLVLFRSISFHGISRVWQSVLIQRSDLSAPADLRLQQTGGAFRRARRPVSTPLKEHC
jgi:hypothetical protein